MPCRRNGRTKPILPSARQLKVPTQLPIHLLLAMVLASPLGCTLMRNAKKLTKDADDKDVAPATTKWGCNKVGEKSSFMMTGAKTLMVATTAALALIGSQ